MGQQGYEQDILGFGKIQFPGKPGYVDTLGHKGYRYADTNAAYLIIVNDLEGNAGFSLQENELEQFYGGVVKGVLKGSNGTLVHSAPVDIDGFKGIEMEFHSASNGDGLASRSQRFIYFNKKAVTMSFWTSEGKKDALATEKNAFFNSFRFLINRSAIRQYTVSPNGDQYNKAYQFGQVLGKFFMLAVILAAIYLVGKLLYKRLKSRKAA